MRELLKLSNKCEGHFFNSSLNRASQTFLSENIQFSKRNEVKVFLKPKIFLSKRAGTALVIALTSLMNFVLPMSQIISTPLERPSLSKESSICEPLPSHNVSVDLEASPVTYHLVEQGTKRCRVILVDNLGFSYNINSRLLYLAHWQCTAAQKAAIIASPQ